MDKDLSPRKTFSAMGVLLWLIGIWFALGLALSIYKNPHTQDFLKETLPAAKPLFRHSND